MDIVLVTHHFPPRYTAGGEQYAYRVARGLCRLGHRVEIVCVESISQGSLIPECRSEEYEGLPVHRLYLNLAQAPDPFRWTYRNPELGQWVERFLAQRRPDLVHVNSGYILGGTVPEAAYRLGIPAVLTLHDYWYLCPTVSLLRSDGRLCDQPVPPAHCAWCWLTQRRRYRLPDQYLHGRVGDCFASLGRWPVAQRLLGIEPLLARMEERRALMYDTLHRMDRVISPSRFLIAKMREYGFDGDRIVYLPFGLERNGSTTQATERPSLPRLRIGYLGQLAPHKGVHVLMDAFRHLPGPLEGRELALHGQMFSGDSYLKRLQSMANGDSNVKFAGPYPNAAVGQVLRDLDVVVVPSVWYENRPTVIIEAFASGTPVIAARLGGMAELVSHGENGLLFESGSADSLREQLQRLLDEPDLLSHLRQGISPVPTPDDEMAALVSLYKEIL